MTTNNPNGGPGTNLMKSEPQSQGAMISVWADTGSFEQAQRFITALKASNMLPDQYKDNVPNCMVALDYAWRFRISPLTVMQNLHLIKGRHTWSAKFIAGLVNSCGRFTPLRYKMEVGKTPIEVEYTYYDAQRQRKTGKVTVPDMRCYAYAVDVATGDHLEGPLVTTKMAVREGWWTKNDSKWPHMPEVMLMYRSASFFGNMYAPDLVMGMASQDDYAALEQVVNEPNAVPEVTIVEEKKGRKTREKPATTDAPKASPIETLNQTMNGQGPADAADMVEDAQIDYTDEDGYDGEEEDEPGLG